MLHSAKKKAAFGVLALGIFILTVLGIIIPNLGVALLILLGMVLVFGGIGWAVIVLLEDRPRRY